MKKKSAAFIPVEAEVSTPCENSLEPHTNKPAPNAPLNFASMSEEQFNAAIEKRFADIAAGKTSPAKDVKARMLRYIQESKTSGR